MNHFRFHPLSVGLLIAVMVWSAFVWRGRMDDLGDLTHRVRWLEQHQDDPLVCRPLLGVPDADRACVRVDGEVAP